MATGADDIKDARGMATADFDNDGDLDIVINNNPGDSGRAELSRATLLRNNIGATRKWLAVELRGTKSNRDAVGATVTIETATGKQLRLVSAGSGFASQHTDRLYFGLGDGDRVNAIKVRWPSGRTDRFTEVNSQPISARSLIRIVEGTSVELRALKGSGPEAGAQPPASAP